MTTPTYSVATRIAAVILCACFSTQALADRPVTHASDLLTITHAEQSLRPFTIAGEIVDQQGVPTPGVTITILTHGGEAITDDLGRYIIDTRIPIDADSIAIVASLPDDHTGQRITTHTASIHDDDPFLDAGVLTMRSGECEPKWVSDTFCRPGFNGTVYATIVWDDGTGPALYAGGSFSEVSCHTDIGSIARWDGTSWSPLISSNGTVGVIGEIYAFAIHDDGGGPALYAGGALNIAGFSSVGRIAKWDGSDWHPLTGSQGTGVASGTGSGPVRVDALASFDDGTGQALYVGGRFLRAGGKDVNCIAKWDGAEWSGFTTPEGTGTGSTTHYVNALAVYDDGRGPALYAAGRFPTMSGVVVNNIAKWNGSEWSPVVDPDAEEEPSPESVGLTSIVDTLQVYTGPMDTHPSLYVGGNFSATRDGLLVNYLARWNGTEWSALTGPDATGLSGFSRRVRALAVFDDGSGDGPSLFAGGEFFTAGGVVANRIAKWNGSEWSALADPGAAGVDFPIFTMAAFGDESGNGPALYVGGDMQTAGDIHAGRMARWNGTNWSGVIAPTDQGLSGIVESVTIFDDGSGRGPELYAGGRFRYAGDKVVNFIARWDGKEWWPLAGPSGVGMGSRVNALAVYDDGSGSGPALYAGGPFLDAGGLPANRIARWNGEEWEPLISSTGTNGMSGSVNVLKVHHDDSGSTLYAGGNFSTAGGVAVNRIAKWNGSEWSTLEGPAAVGVSGEVRAIEFFNDGTGEALYAAGSFVTAGGVTANRIAKWNGTEWSALDGPESTGIEGFSPQSTFVNTLAAYDNNQKNILYIGGSFEFAGGLPTRHLAQWNGSTLLPFDVGLANTNTVRAMRVLDVGCGNGPALYAGGSFIAVDGVLVNRIARWNGTEWSAIADTNGIGVNSAVYDMATLGISEHNSIPTLYVGGQFITAGGSTTSHFIAKWQGCPDIAPAPCPGDITGNGTVGLDDFAILAANFGAGPGATLAQGDLNGDGFVNLADFNILATNFGSDCN